MSAFLPLGRMVKPIDAPRNYFLFNFLVYGIFHLSKMLESHEVGRVGWVIQLLFLRMQACAIMTSNGRNYGHFLIEYSVV